MRALLFVTDSEKDANVIVHSISLSDLLYTCSLASLLMNLCRYHMFQFLMKAETTGSSDLFTRCG